jgi:hypothetical protein
MQHCRLASDVLSFFSRLVQIQYAADYNFLICSQRLRQRSRAALIAPWTACHDSGIGYSLYSTAAEVLPAA